MKFLRQQNFYEFLKNRNFPKIDYRFWKSYEAPRWDQTCVFFFFFWRRQLDHTLLCKFSPCCKWKFPFRTLPVLVQNFEIWTTPYPWDFFFPKVLPSSLIDGTKTLENLLQSDQKWNLQRGTNVSVTVLKSLLSAVGKRQCIFSYGTTVYTKRPVR